MLINKRARSPLCVTLTLIQVSQRCRNQQGVPRRCAMRHSENANGAAFRLTPHNNSEWGCMGDNLALYIWAKVVTKVYAEVCTLHNPLYMLYCCGALNYCIGGAKIITLRYVAHVVKLFQWNSSKLSTVMHTDSAKEVNDYFISTKLSKSGSFI